MSVKENMMDNTDIVDLFNYVKKLFVSTNYNIIVSSNKAISKTIDLYNISNFPDIYVDKEKIEQYIFKTSKENRDIHIYVLVCLDLKVIATVCFSQYINHWGDVYKDEIKVLGLEAEKVININSLYVDKSFRNKGIGKLLNSVHRYWLKDYTIICSVKKDNFAKDIYLKDGALPIDVDDAVYHSLYYPQQQII